MSADYSWGFSRFTDVELALASIPDDTNPAPVTEPCTLMLPGTGLIVGVNRLYACRLCR